MSYKEMVVRIVNGVAYRHITSEIASFTRRKA